MKKDKAQKKPDAIGLYIHVPFCAKKCNYCDFNSYAGQGHAMWDYFEALLLEMDRVANDNRHCLVETIFIGGGTPSLAEGSMIERVLQKVRENFTIAPGAEVSIEANPGTLTMEKLCIYRKNGINRLSMGLQATQQHLLEFLGRNHSFERFQESFSMARNAGFDNINVDLIFGVPGQSLADWKTSVDRVLSFAPEHIAAYSLIIEEGTVFGHWYKKKKIDYLDDDLERAMYYYTNEALAKKGYTQYEISNYAKNKRQCRHNLVYWQGKEYIGLGSGAHSFKDGLRYSNRTGIKPYIKAVREQSGLVIEKNALSRQDRMNEFVMLGLRLVQGVCNQDFKDRFGEDMFRVFGDKLENLTRQGLITQEDESVRLSSLGMDLGNKVFMEFI